MVGLGRLVDGLVPRLLEEVVAGLGRLVDGLVPRLLEEVLEELPEVNAPDSIY